jgi:hypothetical protein
MKHETWRASRPSFLAPISPKNLDRRSFIGGSNARTIMGDDEAPFCAYGGARKSRPEDLSGNLIVISLSAKPQPVVRRNTGQTIECVQHRLRHRCCGGRGDP